MILILAMYTSRRFEGVWRRALEYHWRRSTRPTATSWLTGDDYDDGRYL